MSDVPSSRWFTLVQRELQEYRVSLLWTPLLTALVLVFAMLVSVVLANRIAAVGQTVVDVIMQEKAVSGMNITIQIDEDSPGTDAINYRVEKDVEQGAESDWNFSREWTFSPHGKTEEGGERGPGSESGSESASGSHPESGPDTEIVTAERIQGLHPLLGVVSALMSLVLIVVTVNYLLGCLYDDRRDRSILFWKSMPVSEWEVVLAKLAVALVVAPLVFLAATFLTQLACTLLAMLMIWRMDLDPFSHVLENVQFGRLILGQVGDWVVMALWVAPLYAWLLAASAAARRSPFLTALVPVVGVVILEELLFGTDYLQSAILSHLPLQPDSNSITGGTPWTSPALVNLSLGLAVTVVLLYGTVWLRRHRWEI